MKTQLDDFTRAYIVAALWSTTDGETPLDANYDIADISPDTLAAIVEDCQRFQAENADDLGTDRERGGHDFLLTRNGHGSGFWDGDWPDAGDRLTDASHKFGEFDLYVGDDGLIYA
jgi:hypothetical protein